MPFVNSIIKRGISTSCAWYGKRNFRKFSVFNKRGTRLFKEARLKPDYDLPHDKRGVRDTGYYVGNTFVQVPEMIPDIIVPDLNDFALKPYVSFRTPEIHQSKFTAQDLFDVVYAPKIAKDFNVGKLRQDGIPMEPAPEELQTSEEARIKAEKTGSDWF